MKKTILLIAGGSNQVSLANEVISQGHDLYLVDPNLEAPCAKYSSLVLKHDTRFYLDIIKEIKEKNLKIDGVISDQSDAALKTVSIIAEKLDLPYKNLTVVNNCLNKATQFEILFKNKIKVPKTFKCPLGNEKLFLEAFENKLLLNKKVYVLKPADSQGSKGVYIINSKKELEIKLTKSFKESKIGLVILQEFIEGREYSIDGLISDGRFFPLVCASKFHYLNNQCIDERNTFINDIEKDVLIKLINETELAVRSLNFSETLIHAELILSDVEDEAFIIEISPRGGGGSISSKIIPYITEFNSNKFIIDSSLGETIRELPQENIIFKQKKYVIMRFFPEMTGSFSKISIDKPKYSNLIHLEMPKDNFQGSKIIDSRSRIGYWVIANKNIAQLLEDERNMLKSLKFFR